MTDEPAKTPDDEPTPLPDGNDLAPLPAPPSPPSDAPAPPTTSYTLPPPDPWAHRRGEPRTFAAVWLLFLFAATILSVGAVGIFGLVSTDVYRPAARAMLEIIAVGVVILWPMVRLSQEAPKHPMRSLLSDALVVLIPAQAVIWPQALTWMAGWPTNVVAAVAALIAGWGLLIAGLVAIYFNRSPSAHAEGVASLRAGGGSSHAPLPRWAMMSLIILLVAAGPLVLALRPQSPKPSADWLMSSPLTAVYELTRDRSWTGQSAAIDQRHRVALWLLWLAAAGVWGLAWMLPTPTPPKDDEPLPVAGPDRPA
jgi:hypothetical protein